jgi:ribonuclease HI
MNRLQLSVDGSCIQLPGQRKFALGWAFVAASSVFCGEHSGALHIDHEFRCHHEVLAVIEGFRWARHMGFSPEQVVLSTDDQILGYANTILHPGNYRKAAADKLQDSIRSICKKHFELDIAAQTLEYLRHARVEKVNGHGRRGRYFAEHARADILARQSAQQLAGVPFTEPVLSFEDWLRVGPLEYSPVEDKLVHQPFPFCADPVPLHLEQAAT